MQIMRVSNSQNINEYYADFGMAFKRFMELEGKGVFMQTIDVKDAVPEEPISAGDLDDIQ